MAAPSSTVWGNIVTGEKSTHKGKIGIYTDVTSAATSVTVKVEVWFWSMYSISDPSNNYYYNAGATSATSLIGAININHTVNTGAGWSTSNQTKLGTYTYTYTKGTSASTKNYAAKLTGVATLGSTAMTVTTSVTVPALASYTVTYNMNGGSGSISSQTKYYGKTLTLSSTKPTRTGYSFQGWATSASGSVAYASGASYTANAGVTLYAVWKANTYAIKYNANGGTGAPTAQTKTYGKALTLSTVKPTRSNYNFKGWATSSTATKATYAAGASYTANAAATLYAVWELAYVKPRITGFVLSRCDSSGTTTDEGTYAVVGFSWASDLNVSSVKIEWKSASATSYTTANSKTISASGKSGSVNEIVGAGAIDTDKTYTFRITVADGTDDSHKTQKTSNLSGSIYHIDCKPPIKANEVGGVAVGKPAELDGVFDVGWASRFAKNAYVGETKAWDDGLAGTKLSPSGGIVIQRVSGSSPYLDFRLYGTANSSATAGNYDGRIILDKDTKNFELKGANDVYLSSAQAGGASIRPYRRKGDTITCSLRTAGYVTNGGKDVSFWLPLAVPVIGSPTATAASVSGFVFRQGTKYTHGSSATVYVTPDEYEVIDTTYMGVYIKAVFSDTTNVTNNDTIGIYWSGTITFS